MRLGSPPFTGLELGGGVRHDRPGPSSTAVGPESAEDAASPSAVAEVARLVHVSDLHVGSKFNEDLWESFVACCDDLGPDAVIVTGDLVDTPFRWNLNDARKRLFDLRDSTSRQTANPRRRGRTPCHLVIVPGNHDTRVTGLIPTGSPFTMIALGIILCLALLAVAWLCPAWRPLLLWLAPVLVAGALAAYRVIFPNFRAVFEKDEAPVELKPLQLRGLTVEILPFDSSTRWLYSARGEIPIRQFVDFGRAPRGGRTEADLEPDPFRLAVVHHHPLPIPYDEWAEKTLILRNAGAFLRVLMRAEVRLVLHGHKHRWNFARVTADAETGDPRGVSVLAAHSLTRGRRHDGHVRWGSNLLELDPSGSVKVIPYTSEGGPFAPGRSFYVEEVPATNRWRQKEAKDRFGVACRLVAVTTTLSEDGDARMRVEIKGFRVVEEGRECGELPAGVVFDVDHGHLERLEADRLDAHAPAGICLKREDYTLRRQTGSVDFGRTISALDEPFGIYTQVHMLNSFAMSVQQFERMYTDRNRPPVESARAKTPRYPTDSLQMTVVFPRELAIAGHPELEIKDRQERRLHRVEQHCRHALHFNAFTNTVSFSIENALRDARIR